jgi:hypothetical protein
MLVFKGQIALSRAICFKICVGVKSTRWSSQKSFVFVFSLVNSCIYIMYSVTFMHVVSSGHSAVESQSN